jgi:hypothetical protein
VEAGTYDEYVKSLQRLGGAALADPQATAQIEAAAKTLSELPDVTEDSVTALVESDASIVPVLGLVAGLSQEGLKNELRHRFGTASHARVVSSGKSRELVRELDEDHGLLGEITSQRGRSWTFGDVLVTRAAPRSRAAAGIGRGRALEDAVEAVVNGLGLAHQMRGRFIGRNGRDAPCDLAIPETGAGAAIVCAVKGFDSTGSKLTAALDEIRAMAEVRLPRQYVFAVVDGIGWLGRQSDLKRIHALWESRAIDGLFTLSALPDFEAELRHAATRLGLSSS